MNEACDIIESSLPESFASDGVRDVQLRKRRKPTIKACVSCRSSKAACSDVRPCPRCDRLGLDCIESSPTVRKGPRPKDLHDLKYVRTTFDAQPVINVAASGVSSESPPNSFSPFSPITYSIDGYVEQVFFGDTPLFRDLIPIYKLLFPQHTDAIAPNSMMPLPLQRLDAPDAALSTFYLMYCMATYAATEGLSFETHPLEYSYLRLMRDMAGEHTFPDALDFSHLPWRNPAAFAALLSMGRNPSHVRIKLRKRVNLEQLPFPAVHWDFDATSLSKTITANKLAGELFGLPVQSLEENFYHKRLAYLFQVMHLGDWLKMGQTYVEALARKAMCFKIRCKIMRVDGSSVPVNITIKAPSPVPMSEMISEFIMIFIREPDGRESSSDSDSCKVM